MATFSDRLKQLRDEKNITLERLAENIGITKSTLSRYENNKREPKMYVVEKLANYFQVSTDYLLGQSDERTPAHKIKEEYESEEAEIEELMERFNVHLNGEVLTKEDKNSVIAFLKMLRDRDR